MSYKISKELFEAAMSLKVIEFYCRNEIQYYPADKERVRCIDWIPTLSGCEYNYFFFKCKEYAFCNGYELMSGLYSNDNNAKGKCIVYRCEDDKERVIKIFNEDDELQAVFDACQWIMDKDKQ